MLKRSSKAEKAGTAATEAEGPVFVFTFQDGPSEFGGQIVAIESAGWSLAQFAITAMGGHIAGVGVFRRT